MRRFPSRTPSDSCDPQDAVDETNFQQKLLDDFAPLVRPLLYEAFRQAHDLARSAIETLHEQTGADEIRPGRALYDPYLFSHHVRYAVRLALSHQGIFAEDDLTLDDLPNSGLRMVYRGWNVRLRRSARGCLPYLGESEPLRSFVQQPLFPSEGFPYGRNVLLLWHASYEGEFLGISLIFFRHGRSNEQEPLVQFRSEYGRPTSEAYPVMTPSPYRPSEPDDPMLDLPYARLDAGDEEAAVDTDAEDTARGAQ